MIRGIRPHQSGFTIIELIIVLTISIALMSSALLLFQGRVPKTQFQGTVNDFNVKLSDIATQVTAGNYPTQENFSCTAVGGISTSLPDAKVQGTNQDCIFIGQALHFGASAGSDGSCPIGGGESCDVINIYTVYGKREKGGGGIATSLADASPKIHKTVAKTDYTLGYGTHIKKVSSNGISIGGIAYLQSFGSRVAAIGEDPTGSSTVDVVPLLATHIGDSEDDFMYKLNNPPSSLSSAPNPQKGIVVCLKSGVTNDYAIIEIGKGGATTLTAPLILTKDQGDIDSRCV